MSKLSEALDIQGRTEFECLTYGCTEETRDCLAEVIFHKKSYAVAGGLHSKSKHSVYEALKRLHYKKFGREYGR